MKFREFMMLQLFADDPGDGFTARRESGRSWNCAVVSPTLYAGFPHFHFCANPSFAENFYSACLAKKALR